MWRLVGWAAAANGVAFALALMPSGAAVSAVDEGFRTVIAWCGIG